MIDLAAHVHYKVHFDIVPTSGNVDLLQIVIGFVSQWLRQKYGNRVKYWNWSQFSRFGKFSTNNRELFATSTSFFVDEKERYWACRVEEYPKSNQQIDFSGIKYSCAPRTWITETGSLK